MIDTFNGSLIMLKEMDDDAGLKVEYDERNVRTLSPDHLNFDDHYFNDEKQHSTPATMSLSRSSSVNSIKKAPAHPTLLTRTKSSTHLSEIQ